MIKRIKYGCFALLFITTLTLSSIVAILASSNANIDNKFYLTYVPDVKVDLVTGSEFNNLLTEWLTEHAQIVSIVFDYNTPENLELVAGATSCVSVALDGSDDALLYYCEVEEEGSSIYTVYVLSNGIICANEDSSKIFSSLMTTTSITFNNFNTSKCTNKCGCFMAWVEHWKPRH